MKLFRYEGYKITISEEALLLEPFKKIWDRDKSPNKDIAMMELGYIYFMEDPRSDYQFIVDAVSRSEQIKLGEGLKKSWNPDALVKDAQKFYASFKSTSALVLDDVRAAIENFRLYLRSIDLNETDDKGRPLHTLNSFTSALKQLPALIKDLAETERIIAKEITQSDKVRGAQEKAMFEDL